MPTEDTFPPAPLELKIAFLGHATLMLTYGTTVIHADPWTGSGITRACRKRTSCS